MGIFTFNTYMYVHFKYDLLENQKCNYFEILLFIAFSICFSLKFGEIAQINFFMVIFTNNSGNDVTRWQTIMSRDCSSCAKSASHARIQKVLSEGVQL